MNTVQRNIIFCILLAGFAALGCRMGQTAEVTSTPSATLPPTATPAPTETPTVAVTPTPALTIETSLGTVVITKVDVLDTFPPGCTPGIGCSEPASGYVILVLWLDDPAGGKLLDANAFLNQSIYVVGDDGSRTKIFAAGIYNGEAFVGFTPPDSGGDFTLEWPDNPPLPLDR